MENDVRMGFCQFQQHAPKQEYRVAAIHSGGFIGLVIRQRGRGQDDIKFYIRMLRYDWDIVSFERPLHARALGV